MESFKLNEAELSNVSGGELSEVKDGFVNGMKKPVQNAWDIVTLKSTDEQKGQFLSAAALVAIGFFAPWLYSKAVKIKNSILG